MNTARKKQATLFKKEKEKWRAMFLKDLNDILNDENALLVALNERESLTKARDALTDEELKTFTAKEKLTAKELKDALEEIDNPTENPQYTLRKTDAGRLGNDLLLAGFTEKQHQLMKKSDILKYEAAIYSVKAKLIADDPKTGELGPVFTAYQDLYSTDVENLEVNKDDQTAFEKELSQMAKPLIIADFIKRLSPTSVNKLPETLERSFCKTILPG